jgi:hypothetical protein
MIVLEGIGVFEAPDEKVAGRVAMIIRAFGHRNLCCHSMQVIPSGSLTGAGSEAV